MPYDIPGIRSTSAIAQIPHFGYRLGAFESNDGKVRRFVDHGGVQDIAAILAVNQPHASFGVTGTGDRARSECAIQLAHFGVAEWDMDRRDVFL